MKKEGIENNVWEKSVPREEILAIVNGNERLSEVHHKVSTLLEERTIPFDRITLSKSSDGKNTVIISYGSQSLEI